MILYKQILVLFLSFSVITFVTAGSVLPVEAEAPEKKEVILEAEAGSDSEVVDQALSRDKLKEPTELSVDSVEKETLVAKEEAAVVRPEKVETAQVEVAARSSKSLILYFVLLASILLCVVFIASIIPAKGVKS